jgi:cyclophilin family peptidyl-prolyl cis-trans isomerase
MRLCRSRATDAPQVPRACENFLRLCEKGYYKDTIFHRLIAGFMVHLRQEHNPILQYL